MPSYRRIGVTVKSALEDRDSLFGRVRAVLEKSGAEVFLHDRKSHELSLGEDLPRFHTIDEIDLLMVIGGDGTILRSVRELQPFHVPIVSVNRGTVGFLSEIELTEIDTILPELLAGKGVLEERSVLEVVARRGKKELLRGYALNEAVIAQGTIARLVDLAATINGEELVVYRADGLIVSTPTGSTAYSLAAGGPIVHPTLKATILTPINPYSFSQKPIVIPSDQHVIVDVVAKPKSIRAIEVILTLDGQLSVPLQAGDSVEICACEKTVHFLRRAQDTFFSTLRTKLKWGERVEG